MAAQITLYRPSDAPISQGLGAAQKQGGLHAGTDFYYSYGGKIYDKAYAMASGKVIWASDSRGLPWPNILYLNIDFDRTDKLDSSAGNYVIIEHYDAFGNPIALSGYGHLAEIYVNVGDWVTGRQHIAKVGDTGFNYGKHLHVDFVLYPYDVDDAPYYGRVDPTPYFIDFEEDDMYTDADRERDIQAAKDAKAAKEAIIFGGTSMKYGASLQNITDDVPRRVAEYQVLRGGKKLTWIQDNADGTSAAIRTEAKVDALLAIVTKLTAASGTPVTVEQLVEAIDAAVDRTLGELTGTATVVIGRAPETHVQALEAHEILDAEEVKQ